ncbi:hypothetical protein [Rivibacter subsaxonicus]|uniref:Uncharacterized protein n=1 Tax=Rivibacter subsaxonicus TaxID=457575 RepID=A0A4Q7VVX2_9BURK|nr:hypothetical protein [Rivibacter subsaxonicus]RZU00842.1 hypothetical protein EV670_1555 [Rivibacter subsaxonicus]
MSSVEIRRLRDLRDAAARQFLQRMQAGDAPLPELRELQERVRLADAALADPLLQRRAAAIALLVVALLCTLAAVLKMPSVPFSLELTAGSAALQMEAAGEFGEQVVDRELGVEGFATLESADAALLKLSRDEQVRGSRIDLRSESLRLQRLRFPHGSLVRAEAGADAVRLVVEAPQPKAVVELEVAGASEVALGAAPRRFDFGPGEWLRLAGADADPTERRPAPLTLQLGRGAERSYSWIGLQPVSLRFVERQARGAAPPVYLSSLKQAQISLPATGAEVQLRAGDGLELDGLVLERCELALGGELGLRLSGSARELVARTGSFERSLKPSVLEFLARNHALALFWTAAGLLWGIGAWLRKLFAA